ncbi:hypothetical protein [Paludisphaera mucosa]|uniref:Uncharacterized protein n=1 Tax=Paludisphaera mucosa TaxID=3030827 RepID=A0ABT6FFF1_9BACT|nr:hypothetical protein [Paludisphaera mucosa]MDG3006305.1 hypothetical protein [Paludisphaera mucosa]
MPEHAIRLRAGWEARDPDDASAPPRRVNLPIEWTDLFRLSDVPSVRLELVRRFGRPIGLDPAGPGSRGRLVIEAGEGIRAIRVNGEIVAFRSDARGRLVVDLPPLQTRNAVAIEVDLAAARLQPGAWGEVAIVFGDVEAEAADPA